MNSWIKEVEKFHKAFGCPVNDNIKFPPQERIQLRYDLIDEEVNKELLPSILNHNLAGIADGCADAIVVIIGTCLEYGIPLDKVFKEVMRANMSKLDPAGNPVFREDGKVLKGPNYTPPDVARILRNHIKQRYPTEGNN